MGGRGHGPSVGAELGDEGDCVHLQRHRGRARRVGVAVMASASVDTAGSEQGPKNHPEGMAAPNTII